MKYHETLHSSLQSFNLEDNIHDRAAKAKSILTCVVFATEFSHGELKLDNESFYRALLVVIDYLDEIINFFDSKQI